MLQERLLAPRVVHFANRQLFWECVQSRTAEELPSNTFDHRQSYARSSGLDFKTWDVFSAEVLQDRKERPLELNYTWSSVKAMYGRDKTTLRKNALAQDHAVLLQARRMCYGEENWVPTHQLIRFWSAIITKYPSANLTYVEDRLIAIAGLAKILSDRTGINYVAGLWNHQLPRQLLWIAIQPGGKPNGSDNYVAPSWSWASATGSLGARGFELDPILEIKGAMDLVQVVSIDLEAVLPNDTMPFGRLRSGQLRIRGRILPVSLDLTAWPQGALRKDGLVQFWVGSTKDPPVGKTFLVPVLFTRWNIGLPAATPNSLIVESTGTKGVFRRIGTARLSSLCPLGDVVPQLYEAQSKFHEDSDDDAESEGEVSNGVDGPLGPSYPIKTNPQQELMDKQLELRASDKVDFLGNLHTKLKQNANTEIGQRNADQAGKLSGIVTSLFRQMPVQLAQTSRSRIVMDEQMKTNIEKNTEDIFKSHTEAPTEVSVVTRNKMWIRKPVPKLSFWEAVGSQFYVDFIEGDDDVVRYGHFVFDII